MSKTQKGFSLLALGFIVSIILSWHDVGLTTAQVESQTQGIYHRSCAAKKEHILDSYSAMSDNDIFEQIEIFSAHDETGYAYSLCEEDCRSARISAFINRKQIEESGARDLLDILKVSLGLDVSRESSGYFKVSYQGLREDTRFKLLIDNSPAQDSYNGRNYWQIPADLIERVEIFYGPGSAEFGLGAVSGVIHVLTREQEGVAVHVYGGGFSSYGGSLAVGNKSGGSKHYWTTQIEAEEGPRLSVQADRFSQEGLAYNPDSMLTHAKRFAVSSTFSSDSLVSPKTGARFLSHGQFFWQNRGPYIGAFNAVGPDSKLSQLFWNADAGWHVPYAEGNSFDIRIYANQNLVDNFFQLTPSPYETKDPLKGIRFFPSGILSDVRYNLLSLGGEIKNIILLGSENTLELSGHIEATGILKDSFSLSMNRSLEGDPQNLEPLTKLYFAQNQRCNLYGYSSGLFGACRMVLSTLVLDEWQIAHPLKLSAGFRVFSISDFKFDFWSHISPLLGAVIFPARNWALKFLFKQGLRLPTFEELYDQTSRLTADISKEQLLGNTRLKPELARTATVHLSYQGIHQNVQYRFESSGHFSRVLDAIEKVEKQVGQNMVNSDGGYFIFGADATAEARFQGGSSIFFNLAWFRSYWQEFDQNGIASCRLQIVNDGHSKDACSLMMHLPQLRMNTGFNLVLGLLGTLYLAIEVGSERSNNTRSELEKKRTFRIPAYTLLNLAFQSRPFWNYFTLRARVFNLLNMTYQDDTPRPDYLPGLIPREGIAFYVGLNVEI